MINVAAEEAEAEAESTDSVEIEVVRFMEEFKLDGLHCFAISI